jgi:hypothetical protein
MQHVLPFLEVLAKELALTNILWKGSCSSCVAYDMYLECAEGDLDQAWKIEKQMDFLVIQGKNVRADVSVQANKL